MLRHHSTVTRQILSRRLFLLAGLMSIPLPILLGRVYYLQNVAGQAYRKMAENNRVNLRPLRPERGKINDRFGQIIAQDKPAYRLVMIPEQCPNPQKILKRLAKLIPLTSDAQKEILLTIRRRAPFTPITVVRSISFKDLVRVQVNLPDLPGVDLAVVPLRHYHDAEMMSHITGYMGRPDYEDVKNSVEGWSPDFPIGRHGLEKHLESTLQGVPGVSEYEVNAQGRQISELARTDAVKGKDVQLSLDLVAQKEAWKVLEGKVASLVAIDIKTGGVLAAVSRPGYNPNLFSDGVDEETWKGWVEDERKPLLNRAFQGSYSPGSTFKPLVALASLEEGLVKPEEIMNCKGKIQYGDREFHCWKKHGRVDLNGAISQSCDVYFYELADRLGVDVIAHYARKFGLGELANLGLPEKSGLVPTKEWKMEARKERWANGETLNIGIGQGFLLTTPLQLAVMTARIASGKAVFPHLLKNQEIADGYELPFVQENLDVIRKGMYNVMHSPSGTARGSKKRTFKAAGKTGTVQVISKRIDEDVKMSAVPYEKRPHGVFVGYGPFENPRVAVCAFVEHGGSGSGSAARPAMAVLEKALKSLEVI